MEHYVVKVLKCSCQEFHRAFFLSASRVCLQTTVLLQIVSQRVDTLLIR